MSRKILQTNSSQSSRFQKLNDTRMSPKKTSSDLTLPWQQTSIKTNDNPVLLDDYKQIHQLKETWTLWYHSSDGSDWTINGYEELVDLTSLEEFWLIYNRIRDFTGGMFFLMRKGYLPIWENYQKPVHFFKYITVKTNYINDWLNLCLSVIGETVCEASDQVFGVSISPKVRNLIIRLWTFQSTKPIINPDLKLPLDKWQYT